MFKIAILVIILGALGYIRLAPSDVTRWHSLPDFDADQDLAGGVMRVLTGVDANQFAELTSVIANTARVRQLAGSVAAGKITYIVRSKWMGFPDYITLEWTDGRLRVYSRLRFGQSDLGVNGRRLDAWLSQVFG